MSNAPATWMALSRYGQNAEIFASATRASPGLTEWAMWDFGKLIYWGPLAVNPDIAFEPSVVRPAVTAASDVDHAIFIDRVADAVLDPGGHLRDSFAPVGGARFAEDYLSRRARMVCPFPGQLPVGSWGPWEH